MILRKMVRCRLKLLLFAVLVILGTTLFAQLPSLPSNLTNLKSSDISDEQLVQIKEYLGQNNLTTQRAYELLLSRGMNQGEANMLKQRLEVTGTNQAGSNSENKLQEGYKANKEDEFKEGPKR